MKVVGIDPGLHGALALIDGSEMVEVIDMPVANDLVNPYGIAEILAGWGHVDGVAVESQQAYPRQGVSSSFKTGMGYGVILGVIGVMGRRVLHVTAATWTKNLRVGKDKGAHRLAAQERFPAHAASFARVMDDGRADACLIADWGLRTLLSNAGVPA